jgi:tetratricopeptide (TPR) repeat protein
VDVPTTRSDVSPPDLPAADAAGQVPGYRLIAKIGQGGMGVVYRARDLRLDRDVAVKLLNDRLVGSDAAARRFDEEARITGQLQHPGIPAVHQLGGLPDGRPFLAMKLIKGSTLADLLADPATDHASLVAKFEQVCQAVGYAHAKGVIHRDLKPGNIMVGAFGEVQVMDWGLAKYRADARPDSAAALAATTFHDPRAEGDGSETQPGSVLGTPAFMPPEQAIGAVDQIDERSDVFGLGAILCAILTGQPPYVGATTEATRQLAARAKLDDAFTRLTACGAEPGLVELCKRCLSLEKADRPANAGEVATAVEGLRRAADERARRAEMDRAAAAARAVSERRRRNALLALAGTLLALVAAAGVVGWLAQKRISDRERAEHEKAEQQARTRAGVEAALGQLPELYREAMWPQAAALVDQADNLLGPDGDPDLRARVEAAHAQTAFLRRLDELQAEDDVLTASLRLPEEGTSAPAAPVGKAPPPDSLQDKYVATFEENGFDILGGDLAELVARLNASPVREFLLAALDEWGFATIDPARRRRLFALTAAMTGHDWRRRLPDAWDDGAALEALYDAIPATERTPKVIAEVGSRLDKLGRTAAGVRRLEDGLHQHPEAFWIYFALGTSGGKERRDARIAAYRAALAARPESAAAHSNLGTLLMAKGDLTGATAEFRSAVRHAPHNAVAHNNLGVALDEGGDLTGALAEFDEAIRLNLGDPAARYNRGVALRANGDLAGAAAAFREALRVDPKHAPAKAGLERALKEQSEAGKKKDGAKR